MFVVNVMYMRCFIVSVSAKAEQEVAPKVYTTRPPPVKEKKPGQLEEWQIDQYFEKGYVVVPEFFSKEELQPAIDSIKEMVDALAEKLYKAGKIQDKCEDAGFYDRLTLIDKQFPGAAVLLHKQGILPSGIAQLWCNKRLLNMIEQLIGPNIAGNPVWNLRPKTPKNTFGIVPWHQDNAYFEPIALHTLIPTTWIPLIDATLDNGCMQVASGGHKKGITATHTCCAGPTWYVDLAEEEIENTLGCDLKNDIIDCPIKMGGFLLINNCVPHRSVPNITDQIRWSVDLRFNDANMPSGIYRGLLKSVVLRTEDEPDLVPDWTSFANAERHKIRTKAMGVDEDEFDTTIRGPWMERWEIVNHNLHTEGVKNEFEKTKTTAA